MSLINNTFLSFNQPNNFSIAAISVAPLPTNQAFELLPPKTIAEVFGERVVYPLISMFGSLLKYDPLVFPGAQAQEIDESCQPYIDEYIETVNKLESILQEVGELKGAFLAEQNTLDALNEKYQKKLKQEREAHAKYVNPTWLADTAKNNAEKQGKKDNDWQIAIEASNELNSYSITEQDPLRYVTNANNALSGSKKNKARTFEMQMAYQIVQVFTDNAKYLQNLNNDITKQQVIMNNKNTTYHQKLSDLAISDELITPLIPLSTSAPVQSNCHLTSDTFQEYYIDNENRVNELVKRKKRRFHHNNDALVSRKSMLAQGITSDICKCYHVTDRATRDAILHVIYSSMADGDRRWFNDAVGAIHNLISGETVDVTYESHGIKYAYDKVTDVGKYILSRNEGGPIMFGATADSQGNIFAGTQYNPTWYQLHKGRGSERLVSQTPEIPPMERITPEDFEILFPLEILSDETKKSEAPPSSSAKAPSSNYETSPIFAKEHTILARPLTAADISPEHLNPKKVKTIMKFASMAEKKLLESKVFKRISIGFDLSYQISEHGLVKGTWRTLLNIGLCAHRAVVLPVTLSRAYDAFRDEDACKDTVDAWREMHEYNKEHGTYFTYTLEQDLGEGCRNCLAADKLMRVPGRFVDAVIDEFSGVKSDS